jgi:transcriptional regulator with XRE-family HTH domain
MPTQTAPATVAELVRAKREEKGLSRDRLAQIAGVHVSTVIRLEAQNDIPKTRTMVKISDELELDPLTWIELVRRIPES